ncbi:MAG TPA: DUF5996 family protein, partial [Thermoleophilaceae bacterium]|nr:DUF5996 family protein [Thermoleophilaceae bacterium]
DTLHMWAQIVGKVRLAKAPMVNHWWQATTYVTPRGLTTGSIPDGRRAFEMEFDFCAHELVVQVQGGDRRAVVLEPKTTAQFYAETMAALEELGIDVSIRPVPVEVEKAIPFAEDTVHASYDAEAARLFWGQLVQADRVLREFRTRFTGKVSPVHVFWGALDMAVTRFSGHRAPRHPGGAPNCGDWVMVEGYSHELSSAGFWPGGGGEGHFYSYAYPEPDGYRDHPVEPDAAFYSQDAGQYLLGYREVRESADPDATLLAFLQSTYEAVADHGEGWDRAALEYRPVEGARPD